VYRVPEILENPDNREKETAERVCDQAGISLNFLVVGLPEYHPLHKGRNALMQNLKQSLDQFQGRYRRATTQEAELFAVEAGVPTFLPAFEVLDRPATAEDVKAGKAIFHLPDGKRVKMKLPAQGSLKIDGQRKQPVPVLIVQAEAGRDGEITYGIIRRHGIEAVSARQVEQVKPLLH